MIKGADISTCGQYRYCLTRAWDNNLPFVTFVGLNPSTADATEDDPTIRRCIGFAKSWNAGGIVMINLYAYRSTDPKNLSSVEDPVGPFNDRWLSVGAWMGAYVVACWGALHKSQVARMQGVNGILRAAGRDVFHLGLTKEGFPRHPLYLPSTTIPELYIKGTDDNDRS